MTNAMAGHNFEKLKEEILARSESDDWDRARLEWTLKSVDVRGHQTCLCSHWPIAEICTLRNKLNGNLAEVGNVCVKRFMGIRSDLIFAALRRVRACIENPLNADAIEFFYEADVINDWERNFLHDTSRKRLLSGPQYGTRVRLNRRILNSMMRPHAQQRTMVVPAAQGRVYHDMRTVPR